MSRFLLALLLSFLISPIFAQESAFLIVCDSTPGQLIVLDQTGGWIPNIRSIEIRIDVDGAPELIATSYVGVIKPTNPKTTTHKLAQIKTVSKDQFAQIIDGLQDNPQYVKTSGVFSQNVPPRTNVNNPENINQNNGNLDEPKPEIENLGPG